MDSRLTNSEAKEVFSWFLKICSIPHGSGNVEQISDFLADLQKSGIWNIFRTP